MGMGKPVKSQLLESYSFLTLRLPASEADSCLDGHRNWVNFHTQATFCDLCLLHDLMGQSHACLTGSCHYTGKCM